MFCNTHGDAESFEVAIVEIPTDESSEPRIIELEVCKLCLPDSDIYYPEHGIKELFAIEEE